MHTTIRRLVLAVPLASAALTIGAGTAAAQSPGHQSPGHQSPGQGHHVHAQSSPCPPPPTGPDDLLTPPDGPKVLHPDLLVSRGSEISRVVTSDLAFPEIPELPVPGLPELPEIPVPPADPEDPVDPEEPADPEVPEAPEPGPADDIDDLQQPNHDPECPEEEPEECETTPLSASDSFLPPGVDPEDVPAEEIDDLQTPEERPEECPDPGSEPDPGQTPVPTRIDAGAAGAGQGDYGWVLAGSAVLAATGAAFSYRGSPRRRAGGQA